MANAVVEGTAVMDAAAAAAAAAADSHHGHLRMIADMAETVDTAVLAGTADIGTVQPSS